MGLCHLEFAIIWQKSSHRTIFANLSRFGGLPEPIFVRRPERFGNYRTGDDPALRSAVYVFPKINKTIKDTRRSDFFVFFFHVPAAIGANFPACFHLYGAQARTNFIGDDDVRVWHSSWRQRGNPATPQELAHDVVLARGADKRRLRGDCSHRYLPTSPRATITRMISLVPSRIWCTRRSRTIFSIP